jgi:hypothetical protein
MNWEPNKDETTFYRSKLESFQKEIQNAFLIRLRMLVDAEPTFQCDFSDEFHYCMSVIVETESRSYGITTSQTEGGFETIWINYEPDESYPGRRVWVLQDIGERIINVGLEEEEGFCCKLVLTTETKQWIFLAGEIYEQFDGSITFTLHDEMIFVCTNEKTVEKLLSLR